MDRFIRFQGKHLHYRDDGRGPVVFLLHGFLESLQMWARLREALSKKYRVVSLDFPGHGKSQTIAIEHSMELMAEGVIAVADHLGIERFSVAGHSMGGYVALALGHRYTDRLDGLALLHSNALSDRPEKKIERDRAARVVLRSLRIFVDEAIPYLFGPGNAKKFSREAEELMESARLTDPLGAAACLKGMRNRPDRMKLLTKLTIPVLVVSGSNDPVMPLERVGNHFDASPYITGITLPGVGHLGFIEAPTQTLEAMESWLLNSSSGQG